MLSCVVNSRPHPRRFSPFLSGRPTLPILEASPLALSHTLDALCSKSVHQPFSNQSLPHSFLKMPGCMGLLPLDKHFNVQTFGRADVQTIPRSISFLFKFLRTLLRSAKTQLFSFQAIPHSLPKTTRGGGVPLLSPRGQNETPNCGLPRSYRSERPRSPGRLA